jgi:hypothetical protein
MSARTSRFDFLKNGGSRMLAALVSCSAALAATFVGAAAQAEPPTPQAAIARGLEFLQADTLKWRNDKECTTCHHGTMTIWALSEAKQQGYDVPVEFVADNLKWTKEKFFDPARLDAPRDEREGWKMVNSSALNLAVMAWCVPGQDALSPDELKRIAGHLLRHQEADGSWAWSSAPAKNRPPPFFESDEVATLLGLMALYQQRPADPNAKSEISDARDKAAAWLAKTEPTDTTQANAYKLLANVQEHAPAETLQPQIDGLLARQNQDGGWGQLKDAASDAYATGQTLYVLNLAGVPKDHAAVARGVKFLIETQNVDGSWPMIRRGHPGVTPGDFTIPIIYFGSAWGTMGLMRSVAK